MRRPRTPANSPSPWTAGSWMDSGITEKKETSADSGGYGASPPSLMMNQTMSTVNPEPKPLENEARRLIPVRISSLNRSPSF